MSTLFRIYHQREFDDYSIGERVRPSSVPNFWHVRIISSKDKSRIGKELHVAEDMIEKIKESHGR